MTTIMMIVLKNFYDEESKLDFDDNLMLMTIKIMVIRRRKTTKS